jgi:hypothetical protein
MTQLVGSCHPAGRASSKYAAFVALALSTLLGCSNQDALTNVTPNTSNTSDLAPLELSALEVRARNMVKKEAQESEKRGMLQKAIAPAMERDLFDPASAQYRALREGRNGAICGKVNARNRYGAYVGFKDFVLSKDRSDLEISAYNNGIRSFENNSFTYAYLASCASKKEQAEFARYSSSDYTMNVVDTSTEDPFADN